MISLGRLGIAVVAFVLMLMNYWLVGGILLLIAVLLDVVDGRVARKYNQVTTEGIFLDVMADKVVIISTFLIVGVGINFYFFYLGLMMLLREYAMDSMRSIAAAQGKAISADKFSKIKGILFMVAMLGMIGNKVLINNNEIMQWVFVGMAAAAMLLAYITLVRFFVKYKNILLS